MDRVAYITKRLLQAIPLVLTLTVLVFLIMHLIPGDPAVIMLGLLATEEKVQVMREHLGLDKPLWVQFWIFVRNLTRGDLGWSIVTRMPVSDLIKQRLPLTLFLVAYSMSLAVIITIPLSLLAALKRDSLLDQIIRAACVVVMATPEFWIGILLLVLLGVAIPIFPVGHVGETFAERLHCLFLPAFTMGLHVAAVLTRNLRDGIISTLSSEHVVFARIKGLRARLVLTKHVLRNSMISTLTLFGLYVGWMVGGSVIIESVFALPGLGHGMVMSILGRDYPTVQGFTLVYGVLVSVVYLATDVAYSFLDPRITL
jgi:peptide/nickel transport system permease protein